MKIKMSKQLFRIALIIALVLVLVLVSCEKSNETQSPVINTTASTATLTTMPTRIPSIKTSIPTNIIPTETSSIDTDLIWYLATIDFTQEPAAVTTHEPPDNRYLYKYANVTFIIPFRGETRRYLNLDDLNDNDPSKSDVVINHSMGSGGTFLDLVPTNGATFYYSGLHSMSYDTCLEHFPFTNMDSDMYYGQINGMSSGRDFCVLTDEGRLTIIRFVQDTNIETDWGKVKMELVVTTYKQKVPQVLTPLPTLTPGPSPTPSRYSGMNLTLKQQATLDKNAQAFLDAVIVNDKNAVADLIEYPIALYYEDYYYPSYANTKEEFLTSYDGIFTHAVVDEFKNASLDENMEISFINSFSLKVEDCAIFFSPNGKILQIAKMSFAWEQDYEN